MSSVIMFPHIFRRHTTHSIMLCVAVALLPTLAWRVVLYGEVALMHMNYFVMWCMAWEIMANALVRKFTLPNGSSLVTALILTMSFPPTLSMAMVAQVSFVALIFGKWVFGGLGFNLVNPAMLGRAYAWLAWPEVFKNTVSVQADHPVLRLLDNLLIPGLTATEMHQIIALGLLLIGALFLVVVRVLPWLVSLVYLLSFILVFSLLKMTLPSLSFFLSHAGHLSLLAVAIFMATDMAMLPDTWRGRGIYGVLMGSLTAGLMMLVQPEVAVITGVLASNLAAHFIADMTVGKPFSLVMLTTKRRAV